MSGVPQETKDKALFLKNVFDDSQSPNSPSRRANDAPPSPRSPALQHPLQAPPTLTSSTGVAPTYSSGTPTGKSSTNLSVRPGTKPFGSRASVNLDVAEPQALPKSASDVQDMNAGGNGSWSNMAKSFSAPQMADLENEVQSLQPLQPQQQSPQTPEVNFPSSKPRLNAEDVTPDDRGLRTLMQAGAWRSVLKLADRCIALSNVPPKILQYKLCRIIALIKTRLYKNALDEITGIGDFQDPVNCYETYPQLGQRRGSMVPFSMRVLKAELTYILSTDQSLDPLYNLLSMCRREIERLKSEYPETSGVSDQTPGQNTFSTNIAIEEFNSSDVVGGGIGVWYRREARLMFQIATYLMQQKEYLLAIAIVEEIATKYPKDAIIFSCLGRMHLQMGNIRAAAVVFKRAESLFPEPEKSVVCLMNRGYLALSLDQFSLAIEHFQSVLEIQPNNIAAANNRAICWLYTTDLSKAIASLEEVFARDPENSIEESLVFNLSTLYDLAADKSAERKKTMMATVSKYAPDSFDFRVMKIMNS
eukprot:TRINITY_DN5706_c0_g1_i1.p1 TRINITY_DN5706_c0_g1~~TRINITY_DN5706_c0_g1_i1.p1  ORF type:complete len:532 (-),score=93.83 TRINITY_DN5706_c0_g1_i1:70-1665(-)